MTRIPARPTAASALVAAALIYVGCSSNPPSPTVPPAAAPAKAAGPSGGASTPARGTVKDAAQAAPSPGPKRFPDWPKPRAVLMVSGEQDGYLEPCGCTEGQLGGLLRRYTMGEALREKGWPLALVDLGSLIKDPAGSRGGFQEAKIKFSIAEKALATMKYNAVALSADDLKVGVDEALAQSLNNLDERGSVTRLVSANVSAPGFEAVLKPSVRVEVGSAKIGVTAVLDPAAIEALRDPAKDLLQVRPIEETLPAVLAELEKDTTAQVLLVQAPPKRALELAQAYPAFEVVVSTSTYADAPENARKLNNGKTLLVQVGKRGKYAGLVGFFDDAKQPLRYTRVTLGNRFNGPAEPMKKVVEDEYRGMLKSARVVENFPRRDYIDAPRGATFAGAATCKECHPNTYAKWATTKHAQAFESLVHDPKPNTMFDAECVSCHTTGFEYNSGWKSPTETAYLKGNQCENCHGPGSKHNADPENKDYRRAMARKAEDADRNRLCIRCHDEDNSPKFNFATYWGQVVHKGMDRYDDPKVHRGLDPKLVRQEQGR